MAIQYHIDKLDTLLRNVAGVLRVSILISDANGNQLGKIHDPDDFCTRLQTAPRFQTLCKQCDRAIMERCKQSKQLEQHMCHAGLCDLAMPIIKDGNVIAYIVLGRIRTAASPDAVHGDDDLKTLYDRLPLLSNEQLQHLCALLPQIILDSAITVKSSDFEEDILPYIAGNLSSDLSISALCHRYHISKNTLYRFFHARCGCSVVEFITHARIDRAKALLADTDLAVMQVAEQVGIENYTYFCKVFKLRTGLTPTAYRNTNKKTDESY